MSGRHQIEHLGRNATNYFVYDERPQSDPPSLRAPASQSSRRFAERFSRPVRNLSYIKRLQKVQYPEGMLVLWWDYNV